MTTKNQNAGFMRSLGTLSALLASTATLAVSPGGDGPLGPYAEPGPFSTTVESSFFSSCEIYRPENLEGDNPIILWGNGTGSSPTTYGGGLEHWASWGFVVAAAETSNAGSGEEMLDCLDELADNDYAGQLDFSSIGASGHSQGGGGTIMAARDDRITATAPIQPYILGLGHETSSQFQQTAPMLLLSGSSDILAGPTLNQSPVYRRVQGDIPVFWAILDGASHFEPTGDFGDFRGITTAWWLYQLEGDQEAGEVFVDPCTLCGSDDWDIERSGL